jgi:hypothetical protein
VLLFENVLIFLPYRKERERERVTKRLNGTANTRRIIEKKKQEGTWV